MHTTRYAHLEGYTDICLADNGAYVTTGEDGDVRIWQGFDDPDSKSIRISDKCFAVAYKSGKIYVADDLNEVKKYDYETNEFQGVVTSFTLPVTCIAINKSGSHLLCGSSDFEMHLVDLSTLKFTAFTGHEAPILSVSFDPLEKYVVSASCDGSVRFWSTNTLSVAKTFANLHPKSNDFNDSDTYCKVAWHKDGTLIAVPAQKEIQFYERETWLLKFKISLQQNESSDDDFLASILCFSPDGKYILATTNTQMIYIHSLINKSLVFKYSYTKKSKICSLVWNQANEIIFCDLNGNMGIVKPTLKDSIVSSEKLTAKASEPAKTGNNNSKAIKKYEEEENLKMEDLLDLLDNDEKSNDSEKSASRSSSSNALASRDGTKSPSKKRKRLSDDSESKMSNESEFATTNIEEELDNEHADDDGDEDDLESLEKLKLRTYKNVKKEIMQMDDDGDSEDTKTITSMGGDIERNNYLLETKKEAILNKINKLTNNIQIAFQPSSTPLNLTERFMAFNSVGLITQFNKHNDDSIDIEFHDASFHHAIHMQNHLGHTMADMSKEAIVLACPGAKNSSNVDDEAAAAVVSMAADASSQSKLVCILTNAWDGSKEWSVTMPKREFIKNVCASNTLVACATNNKFLRIYSISGNQREIIALNGSPICLRAYNNCLFVCYHLSISETSSTIGYSLFNLDVKNKAAVEHGILSLSENAKLEWMGFSDEGNPYYYDSNGYLYCKCATLGSKSSPSTAWTPISNLRANLNHRNDNYWIVGLAERNQAIKAILCKGAKYPNVLPKPNISIVQVKVPFCETDTERTQMEQEFWKYKHLSLSIQANENLAQNLEIDTDEVDDINANFDSKLKENLIKMFMFACKANKELRAYEIATLMDSKTLQLAVKYATKTRALVLAQHLNMLVEKKASDEYNELQRQHELIEIDATSSSMHTNNHYFSKKVVPTVTVNENDENNMTNQQDVMFDMSMNTSTAAPKLDNTANTSQLTNMDETYSTPSAIPITATRINPFKKNEANSSLNASGILKKVLTPVNDKSIINEIEERINKQSASSKDKDAWRPTPLKKLSKSKVSNTPNSSLNSFFGKSK